MDGPRYQQILRDRGGRLEVWPDKKPQAARITIIRGTNTALETAVSDAAATPIARSVAIGAGASVADTTLTLGSVVGIRPGVTYQLRNAAGQSEPVVFEHVNTGTGVCTIANAAGLKFAYTTSDTLRHYRVVYDITTDVAEAEDIDDTFRARWKVVLSENAAVTATGGTTTTITVADADAANAYVGCPVVVALDSTTYFYEERVITDVASAGGTTTLTVAAMSEAPSSGDSVWVGEDVELVWHELLFDIVHQVLTPALTYGEILIRWPALGDHEWSETEGTQFEQQIRLSWDLTLQDVRRHTGKRPHLLIGASELLKDVQYYKFMQVLAEGNLWPGWAQDMDKAEFWQWMGERYQQEMQEALNTARWYDADEDQQLDAAEKNLAYTVRMRR